jgi:hypothetical protein
MKTETHVLVIGNSHYYIQGGDTNTLKEVAGIMGLKYDKLEPSKLSASQKLIKVWPIGELKDFLDKEKIKP